MSELKRCIYCLGVGRGSCNLCGGSGRIMGRMEDYMDQPCHWCNGRGWHPCTREFHDTETID